MNMTTRTRVQDDDIDEVARRKRTRQYCYGEWCYTEDRGEDNADAMVLFVLQ